MLKTILGLPFALMCYIFVLPGCFFGTIACKIRGKCYPGIKIENK